MRRKRAAIVLGMSCILMASAVLQGCQQNPKSGKVEIELVQYKPEAVDIFEQLEKEFNETHDDIHLKISSPNDATTILKTRFIREDYPDIIGIGGDINYSYFVDSGILADISDYEGLGEVKPAYLDIIEGLEFVPTEGTYGLPYVANAAGVLYNKDMFAEHGWEIPQTWDEFISLCEEIQNEGIQPLYFGYKDTWTCLAPWNALAVGLAPSDVCQQVNKGETTFSKEYPQVAEKMLELLNYGEDGPFGYGYNDACTAFANGESAMYTIGSYAIPQIKSVNPDMNIGSFVFPANEDADKNVLNSGNDLMFCVMKDCKNKEAAYEVLSYMLEDESIKKYLNAQSAVPCKKGDFEVTPELEEMRDYIENGIVADYQDLHYPSEMSVDAMIQTYLMDDSADATDTFMKRFDKEWIRYNRDIVAKVKAYEEGNDHE